MDQSHDSGLGSLLETVAVDRLLVFTDAATGLRAFLVIDDLTLGPPAVGGTRTRAYPAASAAVRDAAALAASMTLKCSLAGLDAGGAKLVVMDHPGLDRAHAFPVLGRRIQELGGLFYTAGDLGTTQDDLDRMASTCAYVRTDLGDLSTAVARGLAGCVDACARLRGHDGVAGLRIAVQGCGAIGSAVAEVLAAAGAELLVADLDPRAAERVAEAVGAEIVAPDRVLRAEVDVLAPCAAGGVIDEDVAGELRAWAVCGAANNVLTDEDVAGTLAGRGVLFVPDVIAGAGAVIHGFCAYRGDGRAPELIDRLGDTAREILERSLAEERSALEVAEAMARRRIAEATPR